MYHNKGDLMKRYICSYCKELVNEDDVISSDKNDTICPECYKFEESNCMTCRFALIIYLDMTDNEPDNCLEHGKCTHVKSNGRVIEAVSNRIGQYCRYYKEGNHKIEMDYYLTK